MSEHRLHFDALFPHLPRNSYMNDRPNILLFLTDDHGAWANGCYGNSEVQTPTIDALAADGTRFANAYTRRRRFVRRRAPAS